MHIQTSRTLCLHQAPGLGRRAPQRGARCQATSLVRIYRRSTGRDVNRHLDMLGICAPGQLGWFGIRPPHSGVLSTPSGVLPQLGTYRHEVGWLASVAYGAYTTHECGLQPLSGVSSTSSVLCKRPRLRSLRQVRSSLYFRLHTFMHTRVLI